MGLGGVSFMGSGEGLDSVLRGVDTAFLGFEVTKRMIKLIRPKKKPSQNQRVVLSFRSLATLAVKNAQIKFIRMLHKIMLDEGVNTILLR